MLKFDTVLLHIQTLLDLTTYILPLAQIPEGNGSTSMKEASINLPPSASPLCHRAHISQSDSAAWRWRVSEIGDPIQKGLTSRWTRVRF